MTNTNVGNTFILEYKTIGLIEIYNLGEIYVIILVGRGLYDKSIKY
jgi:hypothetical protein